MDPTSTRIPRRSGTGRVLCIARRAPSRLDGNVFPVRDSRRNRRRSLGAPFRGGGGFPLAGWNLQSDGRALRDEPTRPHVNPGLTAERRAPSTKSRLRTIFSFPRRVFSEKRQVVKFDPAEKSFLTVILYYSIDASLPNRRWHGSVRPVGRGPAGAAGVTPDGWGGGPKRPVGGSSAQGLASAGSHHSWFSGDDFPKWHGSRLVHRFGTPRSRSGKCDQALCRRACGFQPGSRRKSMHKARSVPFRRLSG